MSNLINFMTKGAFYNVYRYSGNALAPLTDVEYVGFEVVGGKTFLAFYLADEDTPVLINADFICNISKSKKEDS